MRILLRRTGTALYYITPDRWTTVRADAREFGGAQLTIDEVLKSRLTEVEIVYAFPNPEHDIVIPVSMI